MNKSKYQDRTADFLKRYPEDIYYETLTPSGQTIYYKYEFKERSMINRFEEVNVKIFHLNIDYKPFLYFWKRVATHKYIELSAMKGYIDSVEDPFDVFKETLKKLVDGSERLINILNEKDILTSKLRTFDGLLYKEQQRHKKIDGILSE